MPKKMPIALALSLLLVLVIPVVTAANPYARWATELSLSILPDGALGVPKDVFDQLTPEQQLMLTEMLTKLNHDRTLFSVNEGKLAIRTEEFSPEYQGITAVWNGIEVEQRAGTERNGPPYPGAFSWYEHYLVNSRPGYGRTNYRAVVGPEKTYACESRGVTLEWKLGWGVTVSNVWSVTGRLTKERLQSDVKFSLDASYTLAATRTWTNVINPGQEGDIRYSWLEDWVENTYDEYYVEDWDEDGQWDQCWYRGQVYAEAIKKYDAKFATRSWSIAHPYPCPVCGYWK